jgi:hypothetical protein
MADWLRSESPDFVKSYLDMTRTTGDDIVAMLEKTVEEPSDESLDRGEIF